MIESTERTPLSGDSIDADVCVIGSGPAGLSVAAELISSRLRVVVVESGGYSLDEDVQQLNEFESSGWPLRDGFVNRVRMVGGTSNLWPGRCMALERIDFDKREWLDLPGWPMEYTEYASFLSRAADRLGLPAQEVTDILSGSTTLRLQALPESAVLKRAIWGKSPKRFIDDIGTLFHGADNVRLVSGFTVTDFTFSARGDELRSVGAQSLGGKRIRITSRAFVLSCGGLENARSLLIAKRQNPHANFLEDNVGHYLMDHPRSVCGRIRLRGGVDWSSFLGHPIRGGLRQLGLGLSPAAQKTRNVLNSYVTFEPDVSVFAAERYASAIRSLSRIAGNGRKLGAWGGSGSGSMKELIHHLTPREILPNWLYRYYFGCRKWVKPHKRDLLMVNHCEQLPHHSSRLMLARNSDCFGNPLIDVHWNRHPLEVESLMEIHTVIGSWIDRQRIGQLLSSPRELRDAEFTDASHHIGTTRMSTDERTGVVDVNLKVHGLKNLYVNGSSVFPTGGCGNPTWSIVAFAIRLADKLKKAVGAPGA